MTRARACLSRFRPQERELVCGVLNFLIHADSRRVASLHAVMQQDGPAAGRRRLHQGRHFARMKGVHARVAVAGNRR